MAVSQVGFSFCPNKNEQKAVVANPFMGMDWTKICSTLRNTTDLLSSYLFTAVRLASDSNSIPFHKIIGSPDDAISFWEESDLEVIPDDAEPREFNQIRRSDARRALELYNAIADGNTKMKIEGSSDFQMIIQEKIKILLTRPLGRQLIGTICSLNRNIVIQEGEKNQTKLRDGKLIVTLKSDPNALSFSKCQDDSGNVSIEPTPAYIIFAHELIHALHRDAILAEKFGDRALENLHKPSRVPLFKNLSEQLTIVGLDGDPTLICENALRAEFGLNARVSHCASHFPTYIPKDRPNIDTPNDYGVIRLENAVKLQAYEETYKLLEAGANPGNGYIEAILNNDLEMIQFLLDQEADPNMPDHDGDLPLHIAVQENRQEMAKLLIKGGARAEKLDGEGRTALEFALGEGNLLCALLLIKNGAPLTQKALECLKPRFRSRFLAKVPPEMNQTDSAMSEKGESEMDETKNLPPKKRARPSTPPESKAADDTQPQTKRSRHR
jgi:ankyrin repeat protein/NleD-like pathogen effector protein (putative zinc metallopeptidase)